MDVPKECYGCTLVNADDFEGCIPLNELWKIYDKCPCLECLLKAICFDQCPAFNQFQELWPEGSPTVYVDESSIDEAINILNGEVKNENSLD